MRVCGDALDYELSARDSDRQRLATLVEKERQTVFHSVDGQVQKRMLVRVDRVFVERDRQLEKKIRKLARDGHGCLRRCGRRWGRRWGCLGRIRHVRGV